MDCIVGLPKTRLHHDSILVMINRLTKVAYFILGKTIDDALAVANKFTHEIFRLHDFLEIIISDRDSKFTSNFWKAIFEATGTQLSFNIAYHPQIDGQTERLNQIIEDIL